MTSDRALLQKCLRELESPSGGAQALAAEIRERLKTPAPSEVEVGSAPGKPPGALGADLPGEGSNALWDTNKPPAA